MILLNGEAEIDNNGNKNSAREDKKKKIILLKSIERNYSSKRNNINKLKTILKVKDIICKCEILKVVLLNFSHANNYEICRGGVKVDGAKCV
jgi:hypothetical protein